MNIDFILSLTGCRVVLERMPVMQSPAKIFAMMKKEERRPLKLNLLNQMSENKGMLFGLHSPRLHI